MNIGTIESELNVSSWFVTFTSGQSHKSNSISCITVFIGNDTNLGNTESFVLMFAAANRINYVPSKSKVNITINEDPMDGMQRNCVYNTIHYIQKIYFLDAEFSLKVNRFVVTEGINSTITVCIVLNVGYLEKAVLLTLESEGYIFNVIV